MFWMQDLTAALSIHICVAFGSALLHVYVGDPLFPIVTFMSKSLLLEASRSSWFTAAEIPEQDLLPTAADSLLYYFVHLNCCIEISCFKSVFVSPKDLILSFRFALEVLSIAGVCLYGQKYFRCNTKLFVHDKFFST